MIALEQFHYIEKMIDANQRTRVNDYEIEPNPDIKNISYPLNRKGLQSILEERAATRYFDSDPVQLDHLLTILSATKALDLQNWNEANKLNVEINFSVILRNVTDLTCPAIYDYCSSTDTLQPVYEIPKEGDQETWYLQEEFTNSPAVIVAHGTMEKSLDQFGNHGYRHLLTRGGAAVHNAWLAALSLGYVGSIFAGTLPIPLKRHTHIEGEEHVQLCAFSLGNPIKEENSSI